MPDSWIKKMALEKEMIEPFVAEQNKKGVISYGVSSYGYDARVADEFKVFTNVNNALVDPKNFSEESFVERKSDSCIIPPNSFVLARTVEYFKIPRDVLVICLGKSTYARCGIIVNVPGDGQCLLNSVDQSNPSFGARHNGMEVHPLRLLALKYIFLLLKVKIISEIRKKNKKWVGASFPYSPYLFIL